MAKKKPFLNKKARAVIALLLVILLIFTLDHFMANPAGVIAPLTTPKTPALKVNAKPGEGYLDVYVLDVGQGESIFLRGPFGATMLVDASDSDAHKNIDAFLKKQGVKKLDVVIGTHPHADHIGGMQKVVANYKIGAYYMPDAVNNTRMFENLLDELEKRKVPVKKAVGGKDSYIEWDKDTEVRLLSPLADVKYNNLNDMSVICHIRFKKTSVLLTGDAEAYAERAALMELPKAYFKATVLKVGHHGSSSSTSAAFLEAVSPKVAILSLGANNDYGHPHKEIISALKRAKIPYYRTDKSGIVHIRLDGSSFTIETEK
ncbi:MAG TPA: ComEC/Rec2 family competence protein [Clostridia bacterium]|nr:ComEC/Rec2 family competence protein [Clostridia bacterium]